MSHETLGHLQNLFVFVLKIPICLGNAFLKKLHLRKRTLNSRNLGFAKDSFTASFGFRTLWRPRLVKDPKNVKNQWFLHVFTQKRRKTVGLTMFSVKNDEKPLVLLCFRSKILKNRWFYCVFAQKCLKKALVL